MTTDHAPLDTSIRIVTPENIAFHYYLAGPFHRLLAYAIDLIVVLGLCLALLQGFSYLAPFLGGAAMGFLYLAWFLVFWGYGGFLETFLNGQTLGKRAVNLRVVSTSGLPINATQAMLRNILRVADFFFYASIGFASMLSTRRFQRLGDLASETMVVLEKRHRLIPLRVAASKLDEQIPLSFEADPRLAEALGGYVARRSDLTPERRAELAYILAEPLVRRWNLPRNADPDLVLCSLYQRTFFGAAERRPSPPALPEDHRRPFAQIDVRSTGAMDPPVELATANPFEHRPPDSEARRS